MTYKDSTHTPPTDLCSGAWKDALNVYLDGELQAGQEAALFKHLAVCSGCRRQLSTMLEFRRMSRQEPLLVPAAVDDAFFKRLNDLKRRTVSIDRWADRRPLWQMRTPVSLRTATTVAVILFIAGLLFPRDIGRVEASGFVEGWQEEVELAPVLPYRREAVYVFYPGLTVEAARIEETATQESM